MEMEKADAANKYSCLELNKIYLYIGLVFLLAISAVGAVCIGTVQINYKEAYQIIIQGVSGQALGALSPVHRDIIWDLRLPRVIMAGISGAGLALSGAVLQAVVQNPLAEPYILGIASGASFGAVAAILIGGTGALFGLGIPFWAFCGALGAAFLVLFLAQCGGARTSTVKMVLAGAVVTALLGALSNFIIYTANNTEGIRNVAFWSMGSLAGIKWGDLPLPAIVVGIAAGYFLLQARSLNVLLLGEEAAVTLGIELKALRIAALLFTAMVTGVIVSFCGIFGFVGLMVPHTMRAVFGADHRYLLPAVILVGALFMIWADVLARIVLPQGELPVGILTAVLGAPFFIHILFRETGHFNGN